MASKAATETIEAAATSLTQQHYKTATIEGGGTVVGSRKLLRFLSLLLF